MKLIKLSEILKQLYDFSEDYALYLPSTNWALDTLGIVLDPDEAEDPDEDIHKIVVKNELKYVLPLSTIEEIYENAIDQIEELTQNQMFNALLFYYKNDAFIEF